ncbi:MAG: hypothetical protein AB7E72_18890 [Lysobacterales bacterium]
MSDSPSHWEPSLDADPSMKDWAGAIQGRTAPLPLRAEDWSRRRLAVIVAVIALLFPFYAHMVERELVRREMAEVQLGVEAGLRDAQQAAAASARQAAAMREAQEWRAKVAAVRVVGVIEGKPPVVVVENLPPEGAAAVAGTICSQAAIGLRRKVDGVLRVTRDRGDRPGQDAGQVVCPAQ